MLENPYRGEAALELGGARRALRYSWLAIMQLRAELGVEFDSRIGQALASLDLEVLAKVVAIGLREQYPSVTPADVMRLSPPIADVSLAVRTALHRAFHGAKTIAEVAAEPRPNPLRRAARALKRMGTRTLSWRTSEPLSLPA
jgi:hypothetical protein